MSILHWFVRFVCFTRAREGREKSEEAEVRIVVGKEHQGPTERAKVRDVDCHSGSLSLYSFFFRTDCGEESSA